MNRLHIADTGLFVAMGQPSNGRYQAVRRFARRNDITFVLPERVYEELTVSGRRGRAGRQRDRGWATIAAPLEFSEPIISRVMDAVQRYIANADDRSATRSNRWIPRLQPWLPRNLARERRRTCIFIRPS